MKYIVFLGIVCMMLTTFLFSSADDISHIPSKPVDDNFIVDTDGVLSEEIEKQLNDRINSLCKNTDMRVYIYIKNSLSGYNPANYLNQIMDIWGLKADSPYTILLLSLSDSKGYIRSNAIDMKSLSAEISRVTGMYSKQQGFENAVKYAFNAAVDKICSAYGVIDHYTLNDLKPLRQNRLLSYSVSASLIILIIALAFFFNVSQVQGYRPNCKTAYLSEGIQYVLTLKAYLIKNLFIILNIASFMILYGIYMSSAGKFQTFLIFMPLFLIMISPFLRDTIFVLSDLRNREKLKIEGLVTRVFHTCFRYYFVITDSLGNSTLISCNKPVLQENNYISAVCTRKIKHITKMDILYEKIVF